MNLSKRTILPQLAARHVGVGERRGSRKTLLLDLASRGHPLADGGAAGPCRAAVEFFERDGGNFDVDVDAIEKRAAIAGKCADRICSAVYRADCMG